MNTPVVGYVLGTRDATPLDFWVAVAPGSVLRLDDVVAVGTLRPDTGTAVTFYGVVDHVRTLHEGISFDTDTMLAKDGSLPVNVSYAAHVQVTRIEPEEYLPPQPGDEVRLAVDETLATALHFDRMDARIPAGLMRNGHPAYFNFSFINGEKGAHINISGISGVATKTSYALYLLHAILHASVLGNQRANAKVLLFNVKGEDLFFLDRPSARADGTAAYEALGLPAKPFESIRFLATPRKQSFDPIPDLGQRQDAKVGVYMWSIREIARERLLRYLFVGDDMERGNLQYLVGHVEERLGRIAEDNDRTDPTGVGLEVEPYGERQRRTIETFPQLVEFLQDKVDNDPGWLGRNAEGTAQAMIRRLWGVQNDVSHLIRGDLPPRERMARYTLDPLDPGYQVTVADLNKLTGRAQMFVVGVLLRRLFLEKERRGAKDPLVFIVLDELNKYAPREGKGPIKDLLVEIAERGRSLGIILVGCQQTASEVERRVVGQAAIRVVGRLDAAEAERPEYNFLPPTCKRRAMFLTSGTMFVQQPEVPAPLLIGFPYPAYATREGEVALDVAAERELDALADRL